MSGVDYATMPHSRHQNRPDRKLPNISKQSWAVPSLNPLSPSFFWLNYQSALHWIRKNEDIISKFTQLLQVYPNLIQDSSLDTFWEFLEPLLQHQNNHDKALDKDSALMIPCRNRTCPRRIKSVTGNPIRKGVPAISVTRTSESPVPPPFIPSIKARTPRIHLISSYSSAPTTTATTLPQPTTARSPPPAGTDTTSTSLNNSSLHHGVLDLLQEHFYVRRVFSTNHRELSNNMHQDNNASHLFRLSESDVCVYLFNDSTMNDSSCFHDLCTASALKIPVIFIRHHSQELPKSFTETVKLHSRGCASMSTYIEKYVHGCHESGKSHPDKRKYARSKAKLAPLSVKTRSSSAGELNIEGFNLKGGRNKQKPPISDTDIILYLINSFQTSLVFDEKDPEGCAHHVKLRIHRAIGISECEHLLDSNNSNQKMGKQNYSNCDGDIGGTSQSPSDINNSEGGSASFEDKSVMYDNQSRLLKVPEADNMLSAREWSSSGSVSAPPHDKPGHYGRFIYDFHETSHVPIEQTSTTYLVFDDKNANKKIRRIHFPLDEKEEIDNFLNTACCDDSDSDEFDPGGSPIQFPDIDLAREINGTMDGPEFEM